jgi:hypothetical protein
MKRQALSFAINLGLLFLGFIMAFSGLLIQIKYHMGHHGGIDINNSVLGISYYDWSDIHKISIIFISIFMIFHFVLHWKWYKTIIKKNLITKNIQVITLTIVFILVAITGYIPWLIKLMGGEEITRKTFIEIHDKLALILFMYLILHIIKRLKWFITTFDKLKNKHSTQHHLSPNRQR